VGHRGSIYEPNVLFLSFGEKRLNLALMGIRRALFALVLAACALGCGRAQPPAREPTPDGASNAILAFALAQVGKPYCWGGEGPRCFDCSGLARAAWSQAGVAIPRTSSAQARSLPEVALGDVRPGDILWWPGHVGIYIGGGRMVDAVNERTGIAAHPVIATPARALRPTSARFARPGW
jgi:peptidoglycan DL-endopeptidase CwlO